ncbi:MAG: hypothetical protein AABW67_01570 [Nanoarchaeota archaeon]
MQIKIANLPNIYHYLTNLKDIDSYRFDEDDFNPKRDAKKLLEKFKLKGAFDSNAAEMPSPLFATNFFVIRIWDFYTAGIRLFARNPNCAFKKPAGEIEKVYSENGFKFIKTSNDFSGYLLDYTKKRSKFDKKEILYTVSDADVDARIILLGAGGAKRHDFPNNEENFLKEVEGLEMISNIFINHLYQGKKKLEELTVELV